MNRSMVGALGRESEGWVEDEGKVVTGLFEWVKDVVLGPTAEGVFGKGNPYSEDEFRRNYWWVFFIFNFWGDWRREYRG